MRRFEPCCDRENSADVTVNLHIGASPTESTAPRLYASLRPNRQGDPNWHARCEKPMAESILIVDDDPVQRRLVENMVLRFGYEPVTADGGDAAIGALFGVDAPPVDGVILD